MSNDFDDVFQKWRSQIGQELQEALSDMPALRRPVFEALLAEAIQALRLAMYQGPDRLDAIKLVLEMAGVLKDKPKGK